MGRSFSLAPTAPSLMLGSPQRLLDSPTNIVKRHRTGTGSGPVSRAFHKITECARGSFEIQSKLESYSHNTPPSSRRRTNFKTTLRGRMYAFAIQLWMPLSTRNCIDSMSGTERTSRRIPLSRRSHITGFQPLARGVAEHESALERDFVTLTSFLDADASISAQPIALTFRHEGRTRRYTPDYLA